MFIQERFTNGVTPCKPQVDHQESTAAVSSDTTVAGIEFPRETLYKAVLDRQADGTLRWMTLNKFGSPEYRIFEKEKHLDYFLSQNEMIDIWEIEDRRTNEPKTLYKCCDADDNFTFTRKDELYREIASLTDHGVFCVHDLDTRKERYIQQKRGWLAHGFEEVTLESAKKTILTRETASSLMHKITALAISVLTGASAAVCLGKILSRNTVSLIPHTFTDTLQRTTHLATVTLLTYGMREISQSAAPFAALLISLSWLKGAEAQPYCLTQIGSFSNFSEAREVVISGDYAFVVDNPVKVQIIDVSNVSNLVRVGWINTPGGSTSGVAVSGNYAYVAVHSSGLQIIDVSNKSNPISLGIADTLGYAYRVAVSGDYAYVADYFGGCVIIDVSNKISPFRVTRVMPLPAGNDIQEVAYQNNFTYLADRNNGLLWIYNVTIPTSPTFKGLYNSSIGNPWDVIVRGDNAYLANSRGLEIVDVSNKSNPTFLGWFDIRAIGGSDSRGVCFWNDYVVIGDTAGIYIFDVSNKSNPILVGSDDTGGGWGITTSGNTIFAPYFQFGLRSIAIRNCTDTSSSINTKISQSNESLTTSSYQTSEKLTTQGSNTLRNTLMNTSLYLTVEDPKTATSVSTHPRSLRIGLGVGIAGLVCLGATGTALFYLLKKRKDSLDLVVGNREDVNARYSEAPTFELKPPENEYQKASDIVPFANDYQKTPDHVTYEDAYQKTPDRVSARN
ncbi:MAG: hypothetical protein K940chlam7_01841 [Chlamydiae bacterium]|nr:hypothetical protein [Chlamydiota bacterium]